MPNLINYSLSILPVFDVQEAFRVTGIHQFSPWIMSSLKQTLRKESIEPERPAHENCLVEMGIIPASLAEILVPPTFKTQ